MTNKVFVSGLLFSVLVSACAKNEVITNPQADGQFPNQQPSYQQPGEIAPPPPPKSPPFKSTEPSPPIHSSIDFSAIIWPASMGLVDQRALELALNITGSFEGLESWTNITTNFDKQGMSLGLLSQNFGQGTLQPLLISMRDKYPNEMSRIFSQAHLLSLYAMLTDWQRFGPSKAALRVAKLSIFDMITLAGPQSDSVNWAVRNLYTDGAGLKFIPQWKSEFQTLANIPEYINLQFVEALAMHDQAKVYARQTGVNQLRSYLMMFDVVDQNGDMPDEDFDDYQTYLLAKPKASDDERLTELVRLRIRHVKPIYMEDVRSRKMAIINGQGLVHTAQRNLETQYNFNRLEVY